MKWLMLMLTFAFKRIGRPPSLKVTAIEIFEEVVHKSRKIVSLTLTGIAAVIVFCGGFFIALVNATTQYDNTGRLFLTATLSGGLALIALAVITFGVIFLKAWPGLKEKKYLKRTATGTNLEQALSLLVLDYVKERQMKREGQTRTDQEPIVSERPMEHEPPSAGPLH